jgi:hypothetical protein
MGNQQLRHFWSRYYVTEDGNVFSAHSFRKSELGANILTPSTWFQVLKAQQDAKGYLRISLKYGAWKQAFAVHRMIAEIFVPNPEGLPQVNHKNGVKTDNHYSNLEWVTNKTNLLHAQELGLRKRVDYDKMRHLLETTTLRQSEIAKACDCSIAALEKFVQKCKVQRPEHYSVGAKMNETRSKLVGTKWYRSGGHD